MSPPLPRRPFPVGTTIRFNVSNGSVPPSDVPVTGLLLSWGRPSAPALMASVELAGGCVLMINADWLAEHAVPSPSGPSAV